MYFRIGNEGRRERWSIDVPAMRLISCCDERMSYHGKRHEFWETERQAAESKLREGGISVRKFGVTGGSRTEAHLDQAMVKRLGECQSKSKEHAEAKAKLLAFRSLCVLAGDGKLSLTADDVLYFNLEGADDGTEAPKDDDDNDF